jgi:iron complex outermembrane recepter protein
MALRTNQRILAHVILVGAGCAIGLLEPTWAQTAPPPTNQLDEVIVTAQKREENLQSVPVSVTAISGNTMEKLHVQNLADVTATIPNVQVQVNAGLTNAISYVIRGIGIVGNPSSYVGTEVGTVIDGVVQTSNELGLLDRFDVEQIEILRGPQGTLFGANTTAGVVNIVTRQPTGEYGIYGQVGFGNYDSRNVAVALDFPIIDQVLAGKVEIANRSRDGFYTNLYNGERIGGIDSTNARAYLRWTPSDTFDVTLKVEAEQARNGTDVLLNISHPGEVFYRPTTPFGFSVYSDVPDQHNSNSAGMTLTANWRSPIGTFTSITNYQTWSTVGYQDIDGIDLVNGYDQIGDTTGSQVSEELRDVIHPTNNLEILGGLFAQKWLYDSNGEGWLAFSEPGLIDDTLATENTEDLAAFTQLYWDVTDRLRLQIGGRISNERVAMDRADIYYFNPAGTNPFKGYGNTIGAIVQPVNPLNPPVSGAKTWTNFGDKVGLDYKFTDSVMSYGYYSRGFKSGGFNGRITLASDFGPFNPEFVDSYEVGIKSDLLDHRLRVNAAAFLNKWKDMQVDQVFFSGDPPTSSSAIINAARATTEGVELDVQVAPIEALRIDTSVGYLKAIYDTFDVGSGAACPPAPAVQPVPCSTSYAGKPLPYAPRFTGSMTATYSIPVGDGEGSLMLQDTFNGTHWGNFTEAVTERIGEVNLVNGEMSWTTANKKWTVSAWSRNMLNKKYLVLALDAPPIFTEGLLGNPREFGLDIRFKF